MATLIQNPHDKSAGRDIRMSEDIRETLCCCVVHLCKNRDTSKTTGFTSFTKQ